MQVCKNRRTYWFGKHCVLLLLFRYNKRLPKDITPFHLTKCSDIFWYQTCLQKIGCRGILYGRVTCVFALLLLVMLWMFSCLLVLIFIGGGMIIYWSENVCIKLLIKLKVQVYVFSSYSYTKRTTRKRIYRIYLKHHFRSSYISGRNLVQSLIGTTFELYSLFWKNSHQLTNKNINICVVGSKVVK